MNAESMKQKLADANYYSFDHHARIVVTIPSGKNEETGEIFRELLCYVYISSDNCVVEHFDGSIPIVEEFSSEVKALSFIRELDRLRQLSG